MGITLYELRAELNQKVTSAILAAERLPDDEARSSAFQVVCTLEVRLAEITQPDSVEGL